LKNLDFRAGIRAYFKSGFLKYIGVLSKFSNVATNNFSGIKKIVAPVLNISAYSSGALNSKSLSHSAETNKELLGIHITNLSSEDVLISRIALTLFYNNGAADSDFTNINIFLDNSSIGYYDTGDIKVGIV
jgi:hypothetical protein